MGFRQSQRSQIPRLALVRWLVAAIRARSGPPAPGAGERLTKASGVPVARGGRQGLFPGGAARNRRFTTDQPRANPAGQRANPRPLVRCAKMSRSNAAPADIIRTPAGTESRSHGTKPSTRRLSAHRPQRCSLRASVFARATRPGLHRLLRLVPRLSDVSPSES